MVSMRKLTGQLSRIGLATVALSGVGMSFSHAASAPVSVGVAPVLQEVLTSEVTLIGSAIPRRVTRISAQVDGMVLAMAADRGSAVKAGDELFQLDDAIARFELQRVQAQLAQAKAQVAETQRKYRETERLRAEGHIPQSTLETSATALAIARARREERKAEVARASRLLRLHRVEAPFSGVVVTKQAEVGQWIRSDSAVFELIETDPARIEVPVPEHLFGQVEAGALARIAFESLPDEIFAARVGARVPRGSEGARTFPVWLELDNDGGLIAPGMSARVTLPTAQSASTAFFVPSDALVRRADGSTLVWMVREEPASDGARVATAVPVKVGGAKGDKSQVEGEGLTVGDWVVVRGNEGLRPNQRVRIVANTAGEG